MPMIEVLANDRLGRKGAHVFPAYLLHPCFPTPSPILTPSIQDTLPILCCRSIAILTLLTLFFRLSYIANFWERTSVRVKCSPEDTIGDLKKLIAAQTGTPPQKVRLRKTSAPTFISGSQPPHTASSRHRSQPVRKGSTRRIQHQHAARSAQASNPANNKKAK